jgi:pimeloyl-ACP methyl ester carboxylesterase
VHQRGPARSRGLPRGESSDLFTQVGAVGELLDHPGLEAPVVVGHSFGGFVATFCATARPLRGVVNVDQPFDTAAFREVLEPLGDRLRGDGFAAAWDEFVAWERIDLVPPERQALVRESIRPRQEVVLEVWSTVLETPPEVLLGQVEAALPAVAASLPRHLRGRAVGGRAAPAGPDPAEHRGGVAGHGPLRPAGRPRPRRCPHRRVRRGAGALWLTPIRARRRPARPRR